MDVREIGRQLRSRRAAAGRTVASVALDAGLSVPYVANLENGRGNPTLSALARLASALGTELIVSLEPPSARVAPAVSANIPPPLARLGRTERFRRMTALTAASLGTDPDELASQILSSLPLAAAALGRDLAAADYWRLIDALTLIALARAAEQEPSLAIE